MNNIWSIIMVVFFILIFWNKSFEGFHFTDQKIKCLRNYCHDQCTADRGRGRAICYVDSDNTCNHFGFNGIHCHKLRNLID